MTTRTYALNKTYPTHENSDYTLDTTYSTFPTVYTHTHIHTLADAGGSAVLRRLSVATRLLRLRVPIPPGACMSVPCASCLLSGLCAGPITRVVWCV
jgi:hypothetical protein